MDYMESMMNRNEVIVKLLVCGLLRSRIWYEELLLITLTSTGVEVTHSCPS